MTAIELTALRADSPLASMAAFGCLRVCARAPRFRGSRLSWTASGAGWHAVLHPPAAATRQDLLDALADDVKAAAPRFAAWPEQIKTLAATDFRGLAQKILACSSARDRDAADWFAAFGSDLALKDAKILSTPFDMSVARQKFLADAAKLAATLANAKSSADSCSGALFGPWKYEDDQHSLGWDPSTMKLGAFTHRAPTGMANAGVRAAVWLAFESLPLFPCFFANGLRTRSFRYQKRELSFCWPVWRPPVSLPVLQSLLAASALLADPPDPNELRARGILAIYRSEQFKPNKYLFSFRTPLLVFATSSFG